MIKIAGSIPVYMVGNGGNLQQEAIAMKKKLLEAASAEYEVTPVTPDELTKNPPKEGVLIADYSTQFGGEILQDVALVKHLRELVGEKVIIILDTLGTGTTGTDSWPSSYYTLSGDLGKNVGIIVTAEYRIKAVMSALKQSGNQTSGEEASQDDE